LEEDNEVGEFQCSVEEGLTWSSERTWRPWSTWWHYPWRRFLLSSMRRGSGVEDRRGSTEEQQQQKAAVRHTVDTPGSVATDGAA